MGRGGKAPGKGYEGSHALQAACSEQKGIAAEGTADVKSQSRERTWLVTAHAAQGGREGRCGWQGPQGQAKSNGEYHAKEFDLCSVARDALPGKVGG